MTLNSIFQYFVPKDKKFFPLFEEAAKNLIVLAETLHEGVNAPKTERENFFNKVEELEAKIEEITHKTHLELSRNFITPFDREDIHALVKSLDNVADFMQGATSRMRLYQVDKITKSIRKLTEINLEACQHIDEAVKELKNLDVSDWGDNIDETLRDNKYIELTLQIISKYCQNILVFSKIEFNIIFKCLLHFYREIAVFTK